MAFLPIIIIGSTLASLFYPQIQEAIAPKPKEIQADTRTSISTVKTEYLPSQNSSLNKPIVAYTPKNSPPVNKSEQITEQIKNIKLPEGSIQVIIIALIAFIALIVLSRK